MNHIVNCKLMVVALILLVPVSHAQQPAERASPDRLGREAGGAPNSRRAAAPAFQVPAIWEYSVPLIAPEPRQTDPSRAQKDPTVVYHNGKWHVFMTVKLPDKSAIEYCSFENWDDADESPRTILKVSDSDYYCAPQVFYFTPHRQWYLIYQMGVPGAKKMWVAHLVDQVPLPVRREVKDLRGNGT